MEIKTVAVIGAGTMGNGIAQVTATAGYNVIMTDIKEEFCVKGIATITGSLDRMIKDLSVNSSHLPPTDDRSGEMKERLVAVRQLLISDEKLSKPVEPGVRRFHDPASILRRTAASALLPCDS